MNYNLFNNRFTSGLKEIIVCFFIKRKNRKKMLNLSYSSTYYCCVWGDFNRVDKNCSLFNMELGSYSYISKNATINNAKIGKFCSVGQGVIIGPGQHPSNKFVSTHPIFYSSKKKANIVISEYTYFEESKHVDIGNDVWIGANSIINDGIKIGNGSIIAGGAFVNKDVEPYSIVGGIPAKHIKYRFEPQEIEFLLKSEWWNMSLIELEKRLKEFHDIQEFVKNKKL